MLIWPKIKGIFLFLKQREKASPFNVDVFLLLVCGLRKELKYFST